MSLTEFTESKEISENHTRPQKMPPELQPMATRVDDSYLFPDSFRKADTLENRPGWHMDRLYYSHIYNALNMILNMTRDLRVTGASYRCNPKHALCWRN